MATFLFWDSCSSWAWASISASSLTCKHLIFRIAIHFECNILSCNHFVLQLYRKIWPIHIIWFQHMILDWAFSSMQSFSMKINFHYSDFEQIKIQQPADFVYLLSAESVFWFKFRFISIEWFWFLCSNGFLCSSSSFSLLCGKSGGFGLLGGWKRFTLR